MLIAVYLMNGLSGLPVRTLLRNKYWGMHIYYATAVDVPSLCAMTYQVCKNTPA